MKRLGRGTKVFSVDEHMSLFSNLIRKYMFLTKAEAKKEIYKLLNYQKGRDMRWLIQWDNDNRNLERLVKKNKLSAEEMEIINKNKNNTKDQWYTRKYSKSKK